MQIIIGIVLGIMIATMGVSGLVRMGDRAVTALKSSVEQVSER
jgi:hypothetical protein